MFGSSVCSTVLEYFLDFSIIVAEEAIASFLALILCVCTCALVCLHLYSGISS